MIREADIYKSKGKVWLQLTALDYMTNPPMREEVKRYTCNKLKLTMKESQTYLIDGAEYHWRGDGFELSLYGAEEDFDHNIEEYSELTLLVHATCHGADGYIHIYTIPTKRALKALWCVLTRKQKNNMMKTTLINGSPLARALVNAGSTK